MIIPAIIYDRKEEILAEAEADATSLANAAQAAAIAASARAIEIQTADFTAVRGGRYIVEGTVTITDPAGTNAQGGSYEVWIGSGQATMGGTAYLPSRFSIRRRCSAGGSPGTWATPTAIISGPISVSSGTWTGATFTGSQTFTGQVQHTGQAALNGDSSMTRSLSDARYVRRLGATQTTAEVSAANTTTYADSTQAIITLEPGTYLIETWQEVEGLGSTGSAKTRMKWTGTGTASGLRFMAAGATVEWLVNVCPVMSQSGSRFFTSEILFNYGSNRGGIVALRFVFVVTVAGSLVIQYAPAVAVAAQTAKINTGSFISAFRIV